MLLAWRRVESNVDSGSAVPDPNTVSVRPSLINRTFAIFIAIGLISFCPREQGDVLQHRGELSFVAAGAGTKFLCTAPERTVTAPIGFKQGAGQPNWLGLPGEGFASFRGGGRWVLIAKGGGRRGFHPRPTLVGTVELRI